MPDVIKFSKIDKTGQPIPQDGILNFGFTKQYSINLETGNDLEAAFDAVNAGTDLSFEQSDMIWSFFHSWLIVRKSGLAKIVPEVITLPSSVIYLERIGGIGRFFDSVTKYSLLAAEIGFILEANLLVADLLLLEADSSLVSEIAVKGSMISWGFGVLSFSYWDKAKASVTERFGNPGEPLSRKQFDAHVIFALINACTVRKILFSFSDRYDPELKVRMLQSIELQISHLFFAVSRQLNGLMISGQAEVSSAIAAYSALSIGLKSTKSKDVFLDEAGKESVEEDMEICQLFETIVGSWPDGWREEGVNCLKTLKEVLKKESDLSEIEMDRNLTLSMSAEVAECVTFPVSAVFRLLGSTAGVLGEMVPSQSTKRLFTAAQHGINEVAGSVESSPGFMAKAGRGGVAIETWVRGLWNQSWWPGNSKDGDESG